MLIKFGKIHIEDPDPKEARKTLVIILIFVVVITALTIGLYQLVGINWCKSIWKWIKH